MKIFKTPTILVIEDNRYDELLIKEALEEYVIRSNLIFFNEGSDAIKYLFDEEANPIPDLILLDLNLPKIPGIEVLRQIRSNERTRSTPILIFSCSEDTSHFHQSVDLGISAFIKKQMDPNAFKAALKNLDVFWMSVI